MQAETTPLHRSVAAVVSEVKELQQGIIRLEGRMSSSSTRVGEPLRDANDSAHAQIAFLNFPAESSVFHRLKAMQEFMSTHFPKVTPLCTNLFSDSKGEPSVHGFVQVVGSKCAKRILEECAAEQLKIDGFPDVTI